MSPDLATPIDAPLQWPAREEPQGPTPRRINRYSQWANWRDGGNHWSQLKFTWMEDDPHEPIQPEELGSMGWRVARASRQCRSLNEHAPWLQRWGNLWP